MKAPMTELSLNFDGPKMWRSGAKTAVVGACMIFGNEGARRYIDPGLLLAIKLGKPPIQDFAGWDFSNPWPSTTGFVPHQNSPRAAVSGYEHSLILSDVGLDWVAYVTLFGAFRMSVWLGPRSGLPPVGVAINPRATCLERFDVSFEAPQTYRRRNQNSYKEEYREVWAGMTAGIERALATWHAEAEAEHRRSVIEDLMEQLRRSDPDLVQQEKIISAWALKIAALERGEAWEEELEVSALDGGAHI